MIRNRTMPINGHVYGLLKIVAEQQELDCPETLAEAWLRERLETMPEIAELAQMRAEARQEADRRWLEKQWKFAGPRPHCPRP